MKRKNFLLIVLLVAGTTLFSSCKKEAQIERNLWSNGGQWNIETATYKYDDINSTDYNCGFFTFKKDGSGNVIFTNDDDGGIFTYSNTENNITFIIDGDLLNFNILSWEKNNMTIYYVDTYEDEYGYSTYKTTYVLKKK